MWYLILSIFFLGIIAAALRRIFFGKEQPAPPPPAAHSQADYCPQRDICDCTDPQLPVNQCAEYYDDEELDRFCGTEAGAYADDAVEEFRDILYTLHTADVAGWLRSLQQRRINLPAPLRDEALLIVGEQRMQQSSAK